MVLDYILKLVESEEFLRRGAGDAGSGFDPEAVMAIADLIREGAGHDEYRSRAELRSKTERILATLAEGTNPGSKMQAISLYRG